MEKAKPRRQLNALSQIRSQYCLNDTKLLLFYHWTFNARKVSFKCLKPVILLKFLLWKLYSMLQMEVIPTPRGSFSKRHGVLVLPLSLLALSGWFGYRPGQLGRKCVAYIINFYFILNYILLIVVTFLELKSDLEFSKVVAYLRKSRDVIILMYFTLLLYKLFKPHNIVCLLNDVTAVRKTKLQKGDILHICIFHTILLCVFLVRLHFSISNLKKSFAGDFDFFDKSVTNDLPLSKLLVTVKSIINSTSFIMYWRLQYFNKRSWNCHEKRIPTVSRWSGKLHPTKTRDFVWDILWCHGKIWWAEDSCKESRWHVFRFHSIWYRLCTVVHLWSDLWNSVTARFIHKADKFHRSFCFYGIRFITFTDNSE